jgi:hypothetical protein
MWNMHDYLVGIVIVLTFLVMNIRFIQMRIIAKRESKKMKEYPDFYLVTSALFFLYFAIIFTVIKYFVDGKV